MKYGEYDFKNEIYVDFKNHKGNDSKYTEVHESVHFILSSATSYGVLLKMLNKVSKLDETKDWLINNLSENMKSMQEMIATSVELLNILKDSGKEQYLLKCEELKLNTEYYKFFKGTSKIIESVTEKNVDLYIDLLIEIGRWCLNIDVNELPDEIFESQKNFKKFRSNKENSEKFLPNTRFKIFLKNIDVEKEIKNLEQLIYLNNYKFENCIDICKEKACEIYKNSNLKYVIEKRISTFEIRKVDKNYNNIKSNTYPIIPRDFKEEFKKLKKNDINNIYKSIISIHEINSLISKDTNNDNILFISNPIQGVNAICIICYNLKDKKMKCGFINFENYAIFNILKNSNIPTILDKRIFLSIKDYLDSDDFKKTIYVNINSSLLNNENFIRQYFNEGIYCLDNNVMCIKKNNYIMIQLLSKNINNNDIQQKELKLDYKEWSISGMYRLREEISTIVTIIKKFDEDSFLNLI